MPPESRPPDRGSASPTDQPLVLLCTVPEGETAEQLAHLLVERQLAACVNILPGITSVYRWKSAIEQDAETLLIIKTRRELFEPLRQALVEAHPYDVPELIALPVERGHQPYLDWLHSATKSLG